MGLSLIVKDLNAISETTVMLRYPDGLERESYIMLAGTIQDQQELDKLCCEGAQNCKQCLCPKGRLHEAHSRFPPRISKDVERPCATLHCMGDFQATGACPATNPSSLKDWIPRAGYFVGFPLHIAPINGMKMLGSC